MVVVEDIDRNRAAANFSRVQWPCGREELMDLFRGGSRSSIFLSPIV